jgi:WD40 repeat protein
VITGLSQVWDVAFSPDGRVLAAAGAGGAVPLIDVAAGRVAGRLLTDQTTRVNALAFSPDGRLLATGGGDGTIIVWDIIDRQATGFPLAFHSDPVFALRFDPDGRVLASADLGGRIFLSVIDYEDPVALACAIAARDLTAEERTQYVGGDAPAVDCSD